MQVMKSYHDLCKEIEVIEIHCDQLEREVTRIFKLMYTPPKGYSTSNMDGMPRTGRDDTTFDRLYLQMIHAESELNAMREILTDKRLAKRRIEERINEFEGLEYKVAYKRDIEGKSLEMIAHELGYSYDHIARISSGIGKRFIKQKRPS